ncbi:MAG: hypothetical protein C5B50_05525 [Verrucomicrobia bacterium]|nr:MAG: hypothetical protein C5B50_05525 [Verrucomicrobiota bacterium]
MPRKVKSTIAGFPEFNSNVTFVPIQYFTVIIPHRSRGAVRIVGYALRKVLGYADKRGDAVRGQLRFTYKELIEEAGVSRESIAQALREAMQNHCLRCVEEPCPARKGQAGRGGVYELCWQHSEKCCHNPKQFQGFHNGPAALEEEGKGAGTVILAKTARKNIPNCFFDILLPRERLSVIRVVGALLFYSIQWTEEGERAVAVSKSITELSRLTNMSRQHVHSAVSFALRAGYIEQKEAGRFDPAAGRKSCPTTYCIRWAASQHSDENAPGQSDPNPVRKGERILDRSKKVDGAAVKKGEWSRSEKGNGEESKMANGIRIKKEHKNIPTAADVAAALSALNLLRKAGFDEATAKRLAGSSPWQVIERQVQWLPQRNVKKSRLGMLRRAIEGDWPKPQAAEHNAANDPAFELGRHFASHYYAGYHGLSGEAGTEPFEREIELATKFVARLLAQERNESLVPEWGRRFGLMMRERHYGDPKARPNLSFTLVLFGDKFLRLLQTEGAARARKALGEARDAHQKAFTPEYLNYLRIAENELQQTNPAVYDAYLKHRQKLRESMKPFLMSAERLALFDSDESRLSDFAEFCRNRAGGMVFDFWAWDKRLNRRSFNRGPGTRSENGEATS